MTKNEFYELLKRLAMSIGFTEETWFAYLKQNIYLPQLVSTVVEKLWLDKIENEDTKILRQQYASLRSTGEFDFVND